MKINFAQGSTLDLLSLLKKVKTIDCDDDAPMKSSSSKNVDLIVENVFNNFPMNPLFLVRSYFENDRPVIYATKNAAETINAISKFYASSDFNDLSNQDKNRFECYHFNIIYSDADDFPDVSLDDFINYVDSKIV